MKTTINVLLFFALTFFICCLIRTSDGWMMCPVSLTLPCTTNASSGRSVLMPTLPVWTIDSDVVPRCQHSSVSLSNCPGFEAYNTENGNNKKRQCRRRRRLRYTVYHNKPEEYLRFSCRKEDKTQIFTTYNLNDFIDMFP